MTKKEIEIMLRKTLYTDHKAFPVEGIKKAAEAIHSRMKTKTCKWSETGHHVNDPGKYCSMCGGKIVCK